MGEPPTNTPKWVVGTLLYSWQCSVGSEGQSRGCHFVCTHITAAAPSSSIGDGSFPSIFLKSTSKLILSGAGKTFGRTAVMSGGQHSLSKQIWDGIQGDIEVPNIHLVEAAGKDLSAWGCEHRDSPGRSQGSEGSQMWARSTTATSSASTVSQLGGWTALLRHPLLFCTIPLWIRLPANPKCSLEEGSHFHSSSVVARAHFPYCSSVN